MTGIDFSPAAIDAAGQIAGRAGLTSRGHVRLRGCLRRRRSPGTRHLRRRLREPGRPCCPECWAERVGALLAPGGRFYLHDDQPLAWALADDQPVIECSHFEELEPFVGDSDATYTDAIVRSRIVGPMSGITAS